MAISAKQIMDCMENPVKVKILILLQKNGELTPKEMLKNSPEIPQASLYRALKSMEADGIIEVIAETKIRAVTEKTYSISKEFACMEEEIVKNNDGKAFYKLFSAFVIDLLRKFEVYSEKENLDIAADGASFNAMPVYATAEELLSYSKQIEEILAPAAVKKHGGQTLHTFAAIVTPPAQTETEALK